MDAVRFWVNAGAPRYDGLKISANQASLNFCEQLSKSELDVAAIHIHIVVRTASPFRQAPPAAAPHVRSKNRLIRNSDMNAIVSVDPKLIDPARANVEQ